MKLNQAIWCALLGFLGLSAIDCLAQLSPEQLLERGKDRGIYTNDWDGAIADFTLALVAKTNWADAYAERGWAYWRKTNYDAAMLDFGSSIQADTNCWEAYKYRALTERKMGNLVGCMADLHRMVQLSPTNASELLRCATIYQLVTNWDGAIDCCSQAIKLWPTRSVGYWCRAVAENAKGRWPDALSDMNQTMRFKADKSGFSSGWDNESNAYEFAFRGSIKNQMELYDSAIADASRSLGYIPTNGFAYSARAWARFGKNDIPGAIEDCKLAVKFNEDDAGWKYRDQGLLYFLTKDYQNAIVSWNKAIEVSHQEFLAGLQPWIKKAKEQLKASG